MQTNNITEKNRRIAEFMGIPKCDRCDDCGMYKFGAGIYRTPIEMGFHKSWDAIMPVVTRIESLGSWSNVITYAQTKKSYTCAFYNNDEYIESESGSRLSAVYEAVCEFISHTH